MPTSHVGVGPSFRRRVAEMSPPFNDLFRRAAADAELKTAVADQVRRARVLDHIERVLVPHVDHAGSDLDTAGPGANRREQWKGGRELLGEVVHPKVRAVHAELLGGHGQLDRLLEDIPRGSHG
jgi:hypothetical protein